MKRKTIFIILVAMMAVAFSCARDEAADGREEIAGQEEAGTRVVTYCYTCNTHVFTQDGECPNCGPVFCHYCGGGGTRGPGCNECRAHGTPKEDWENPPTDTNPDPIPGIGS